ncbi:MAG: NAD(P)-dependent oxidoreductase [Chloroflexi bacterium]|nr:NAD(P)-dependent oxidoreductase [Chloroflexota bacterium]
MGDKPRVGFIGIGMMGKPMSKRALHAGYPLTVYDIRPGPVEELVAEGAARATNPEEVARGCDVVLTSLPSTSACEEVYFGSSGLLKGAKAGQTLVETSTVPPSLIRKYAGAASQKGVVVIDAALLAQGQPGRKGTAAEIAARGQIMVVVGGKPEEVEKVRPVLETFGNPVLHMGPLGSGEIIKILNNSVAQTTFCIICEVLAMGAKAGVNMNRLYEVLTHATARSWAMEDYVTPYLQDGKGSSMRTEAALKDSASAMELAKELGVPALMLSLRHTYYEWAQNSGLKDRPAVEMLELWEGIIGKPIRFE